MGMYLRLVMSMFFTFLFIGTTWSQDFPANMENLSHWYIADSAIVSGGLLETWENEIPEGSPAIQTSMNARPSLSSAGLLNNHTVVVFDGSNDFLDIPENMSIASIFILANHNGTSFNAFNGLFTGQSNAADNIVFVAEQNSSSILTNGIFESDINTNGQVSNDFSPLVDYKIINGNLPVPAELAAGRIGRDRATNNRNWNGEIAEILVYNQVLSQEAIDSVQVYLMNKYAPEVNLGPDTIISNDFCPITLSIENRFKEFEWSTGDESLTITVTETGMYRIETVDIFNRTISDSIYIEFPGNYLSSFSLCSDRDSLWATELAAFDLEWQDGAFTTDYLIDEPGEYYFTVSDNEGCSFSSDTVVVTDDTFPEIVELIENPNFCQGNDLFLASGFDEAIEYLWNTGEDTPFILPDSSGEYWVEAVNENNCIGRDTIEVNFVGIAPEANFQFSPPCENNDVEFSDTTVPDGGAIVNQWSWTFENNDQESSTAENPSVFYPSVGEFPVELTVTLDNGCSGTVRDTIFVNQLPLVNFSAPLICAGNEVFFEGLSAVPDGGTIAQQEWVFGNNTTDSGVIGSTIFEEIGNNTVRLIVTTENACTDSLTRMVEVLGSPIANFDVEDICVNQSATFNEDVDISASGSVFYNWQFGDGFFSNFPNTEHEYAEAGIYDVTLTAIGNNVGTNGCVDQITKQIRVYDPPLVETKLTNICLGEVAELIDLTPSTTNEGVADQIVQRSWSLLDGPSGNQEGLIGTDSVQSFLPASSGTFEISLEIETQSGCTAIGNGSFLVEVIPEAEFTLDLPAIDPPFTVSPINNSINGESFLWFLNNTQVSTEFEPALSFLDTASYELLLIATNDIGCNDTAKANFDIISPVFDLALLDLDFQLVDGRLLLNAIIGNNGNVVVETFNSEIEVGRNIKLSVISNTFIEPGQVLNIPLSPEIEFLSGRDAPYACLQISDPNDRQDIDATNNSGCVNLDELKATFASPFPNPANDRIALTIILPEPGVVNVSIASSDGKQLINTTYNIDEGLNLIDFPLAGWPEGMYFIKYNFRNQEEVHRMVIAR